jgi:hypothetical protein
VTGETTFFGGSGNDARNVTVRECDGFANQKLAIQRRGSDKQFLWFLCKSLLGALSACNRQIRFSDS